MYSEQIYQQFCNAKQQNKSMESKVQKLKIRIQLLQSEDEAKLQKIKSQEKKIQKQLDINDFKEYKYQLQKNFKSQIHEQNCYQKRQAQTQRFMQQKTLQELKMKMIYDKKKDYLNLSQQHENFESELNNSKISNINANKQKVINLKQEIDDSQNNIQNFWNQKRQLFQNEKIIQKEKYLNQTKHLNIKFQKLIDNESSYLNKLQLSQQHLKTLETVLQQTQNSNIYNNRLPKEKLKIPKHSKIIFY